MLERYVVQSKSKLQTLGRRAFPGARDQHGATGWSPSETINLRQPQDGAIDTRSRIAEIRSHIERTQFMEPEDARLTGGTRSLMRRLMGLNINVKPAAAKLPPVALRTSAKDEAQVA